MPVYLFTLHAYRTWRADNPRGYIQHGQYGVQPPRPKLATHRESIAKHPAVVFNKKQRSLMLRSSVDVAGRRGWALHAAAVTTTHIHLLVSWNDHAEEKLVCTTFKRLLGLALSKQKGSTGNRWFSHGRDAKRVTDRKHFDHLVKVYLPRHVSQGGDVWLRDGG